MATTMFCTACGTEGKPASKTPGSLLIEIILWLCFLIPGLIYSIWRISARKKVCAACGAMQLVPPGSPVAKQMREKLAA